MASSYQGANFTQSFMQGFSFVDEIKRSRRNDKILAERLKEEREERSYQRRRQNRADMRVEMLFDQQQEDRADSLDEERLREEGDAAAMNPDATVEELTQYAPYSDEARAVIKRKNDEARLTGAIRGGQTIDQATESQGPQSLSEAVAQQPAAVAATGQGAGNAPGLPTMTPEERAAHDQAFGLAPPASGEFAFGKDRGASGMQVIDVDEASQFDPEYQKKGLLGKGGDKLAGLGAEVTRGFGDIAKGVINAPAKIRGSITGEGDFGLGTQNVGDEFGGNISVPADRFTTSAEFEEMAANGATQAEISAARNENIAVLNEYKKAANRPGSFLPKSRQGALLEGSDIARRKAENEQAQAVKRANEFLDPTQESPMEQMALEDPRAATVMYLQDRATLEGVNPELARRMDARMLPIIDQAEQEMRTEIQAAKPDSMVARKQMAALGNLHTARNAIYKGQPSVAAQANINKQGLKIGDQPRAQSVVDTIFDPNRVVPQTQTPAQVRSAATVAGRISPNKRLNDYQIESLAVLAQAGWIDKATAMSVAMTGAWPPGKDPNGIAKIQEAGGNVYTIDNAGRVAVLQHGKGNVPDPVPSREIGEDQISWITAGIRGQYPNVDDNGINQMLNVIMAEKKGADGNVTGGPGWVRSRFNVTSQEDMRRLGMIMAESMLLQGKKYTEMKDGFLWFDGNTKNAPTYEQILMNPDMRDKLANEFEMEYTPLPDVKDLDGLDDEAMRQSLREGRAGPTAAANADRYTADEVKMVYGRDRLMQLEAQGRLILNDDGTYTILPEQGQ